MNVLTFDIEEWFHLLDAQSTSSQTQWEGFDSRIHANMTDLLGFLVQRQQKATFFCLGWIADKYPEIIREIDELGFGIGSHSDLHRLVYTQTRQEFKSDLERSVKKLEDLTGKKITIYRAPGFSITRATPWAFEVLVECGIEIDCSVFTARRAHGGYPGFAHDGPCLIERAGIRLKELPVSPYRLGPLALPFSGGGYLRITPYPIIRHLMRRSDYAMVYLHYRDFDSGQGMIEGLPLYRRFKAYVGIRGAFRKLERLISNFDFTDIATADSLIDWDKAPVAAL